MIRAVLVMTVGVSLFTGSLYGALRAVASDVPTCNLEILMSGEKC